MDYYRVIFPNFSIDIMIDTVVDNNPINDNLLNDNNLMNEIETKIKEYHFRTVCYEHDYISDISQENNLLEKYGIKNEDLDNGDWKTMVNTVWLQDNPVEKYKVISVKKLPSCEGCRYDAHAQKDHMEEGGCLYNK